MLTLRASARLRGLSAPVVTTCCKHNFFLTDHALVSGACIHHVEYFRQVCDEFSVGNRPIPISVDLIHHFLGPKTPSITSSCEGRDVVVPVGADECFCMQPYGEASET
jgi:hypothetical protein